MVERVRACICARLGDECRRFRNVLPGHICAVQLRSVSLSCAHAPSSVGSSVLSVPNRMNGKIARRIRFSTLECVLISSLMRGSRATQNNDPLKCITKMPRQLVRPPNKNFRNALLMDYGLWMCRSVIRPCSHSVALAYKNGHLLPTKHEHIKFLGKLR